MSLHIETLCPVTHFCQLHHELLYRRANKHNLYKPEPRVSQNHSHSIIHSSLYWKAQSRPLPLLSSSPTMNVAVVQNCANGAQMTQPCLTSLARSVISILLHLICTFCRSPNSNLRRGWLAGWSSAWESQTDQVSHPRPHLHNLHRWVFVFDNGDVFVFAC